MLDLLKAFFRNPAQVKYLPVFACLLMAAVFTPITHEWTSVVVPLALALIQTLYAGQSITKPFFYAYLAQSAIFGGIAVMLLFVGALQASAISSVVALLPVSILYTRQLETPPDVQ